MMTRMNNVGEVDAASAVCACGSLVKIKSTGECSRCYQRRRRAEKRAASAVVTPIASEMSDEAAFFDETGSTPVPAAAPFLPESGGLGPIEYRDSGTPARFRSSTVGSRAFRSEFLTGARMMGLDTARKPLHPQQYLVGDVMNATGDDGLALLSTIVVCIPRRASKTTSIWATALGRCMEREEYAVAFTAQTGTKARDRFLKDLVAPLERKYGKGEDAGFKINRSRGGEHITFSNGSSIVVLPPIPDSFRGDGYDLVIIDEAQTQGPEETVELKAAILPTFDTRPGAQLIIAGTAGKHRSGMLWEALEDGRHGRAQTGIVEYSAGDTLTEDEMADPAVWAASHPGIGTLTTLPSIERNYEAMKARIETFAAEYLGVWPISGGGRFLDQQKWTNGARRGDLPSPPAHFALGVAVHPDQASACIMAAWRDDDGRAHLLMLDHRSGVDWLAVRAAELARKYRAQIAHDTVGVVLVEVEALNRARPRPRMAPQTLSDIKTSAALLVKTLDLDQLVHYNQDELNDAARLAIKRKIGSGWALGRGTDEDDITPLEAGSYALHLVDSLKKREAFVPLMAS